MGCVRKRGKSWNAQVRVSGWVSFTKPFPKKSDAVLWVNQLEYKLRSAHNMHIVVASDMYMSFEYKSPHRPSLSDKFCNRFGLREN